MSRVKRSDITVVLDTRREGVLRYRRYRKPNGRVVKSMELPWTLWLQVKPTVERRLAGFEKAEAARDRIAEVENLLRQGNKAAWIAAVLGMTDSQVRQIKARMKGTK